MKIINKRTSGFLSIIIFTFLLSVKIAGQTIGENFFAFEAEDTESDLGLWKLVIPGDSGYINVGPVGPVNETHLEFTGNNPNSGPASSLLEYKFTCPKTGEYRLVIHMW